ncbi:MAG: flagellar basal body rod protein FlgB [Oscillospiraceae bacterium]|nr:flagellar basal body rod protein FlgB [Oscillospiraceae bacterium]
MLNRMFNHVNLMNKSLDASWLKMEINIQNIANADTPGYDAKRVEFDGAFARALSAREVMDNRRTRDKHISFHPPADPMAVTPAVVTDTHYVMRMDDNNVDPDHEMVELAKNTIQYNALVTKLNKEFGRLRMVVREGR